MIEANSTIEISVSEPASANSWTYQPYIFSALPKYSGYYTIGGLSVSMVEKPNWFHRKMMKLCLGWEWRDGSPF
jgi:hypothetical protein